MRRPPIIPVEKKARIVMSVIAGRTDEPTPPLPAPGTP